MSNTTPEKQAELLNPTLDLPPDPLQLSFDALFDNEPADAAPETVEEPVETAEEPVEAAPEPPAHEPEPNARALAVLARKEAEIRQRETALKSQEAEYQRLAELRALAEKGDRLGMLEKMGVSYDDLTKDYVSGMGRTPEELVREQLNEYKQQMDAQLQELRNAQTQREAEAERARLHSEIRAAGDQFALVNGLGGHDLVAQTIQSHYSSTGDVLSYEDAAEVVEGALGDLAERLFNIGPIREKFLSKATPPESRSEPKAAPSTLSNRVTQDSTVLVEDGFDPATASDDEMIERLAQQLRFI